MDFELSWLLLGLPLAFVLGWLASRLDLRQLRIENRQAPKAYFKGLNFLLNEQQDQAIDAFIEAVQSDPDTSELHFALGNLFRRRGEYERAVRVHEHLLSRGDLSQLDRQRAQHALALDYLKAGLLDRAQTALEKLEKTPFEAQARLALLANHERSRDWVQAAEIARKLEASQQGSFDGRLAHYLCEQAATQLAAQQQVAAQALLQQAVDTAPHAARPRLELARLTASQGAPAQACDMLLASADAAPEALPLLAGPLATYAIASQRASEVLAILVHATSRPLRSMCSTPSWRWRPVCSNPAPAPVTGMCGTCSASPRWWLLPSGSKARNSNMNSFTLRYNARWTMPSSR